jgi:hypothetical protein
MTSEITQSSSNLVLAVLSAWTMFSSGPTVSSHGFQPFLCQNTIRLYLLSHWRTNCPRRLSITMIKGLRLCADNSGRDTTLHQADTVFSLYTLHCSIDVEYLICNIRKEYIRVVFFVCRTWRRNSSSLVLNVFFSSENCLGLLITANVHEDLSKIELKDTCLMLELSYIMCAYAIWAKSKTMHAASFKNHGFPFSWKTKLQGDCISVD